MNLKVAVVGIICFGPSSYSTTILLSEAPKTEIYSINLERGTATGVARWGNPLPAAPPCVSVVMLLCFCSGYHHLSLLGPVVQRSRRHSPLACIYNYVLALISPASDAFDYSLVFSADDDAGTTSTAVLSGDRSRRKPLCQQRTDFISPLRRSQKQEWERREGNRGRR